MSPQMYEAHESCNFGGYLAYSCKRVHTLVTAYDQSGRPVTQSQDLKPVSRHSCRKQWQVCETAWTCDASAVNTNCKQWMDLLCSYLICSMLDVLRESHITLVCASPKLTRLQNEQRSENSCRIRNHTQQSRTWIGHSIVSIRASNWIFPFINLDSLNGCSLCLCT